MFHTPKQSKKQSRKEKNTKYIGKIKETGCIFCGSLNFLTFHHKDKFEKKFNIGSGRSKSPNVLIKEIAKCDLVCELCHNDVEILSEIGLYHGANTRQGEEMLCEL